MKIHTATWRFCWAGILLGISGCVFHGPHQIKHVWFDYNSLRAPALFIDETDHLPLHAARIEQVRWQYGLGPNKPHGGFPGEGIIMPAGALAPMFETAPQQSQPTSPETESQPGDVRLPPLPPTPTAPSGNVPPPSPDTRRSDGLAPDVGPPASRPSIDGPMALSEPRRRT